MVAIPRTNTAQRPPFLDCIEFAEPLPEGAPRVAIVERFVGAGGWKVRDNPRWRWQVNATGLFELDRRSLSLWFVGADNVPFRWTLKDGDRILRKLVVDLEKLKSLDYSHLGDNWYMRFTGKLCSISAIELVKLI